MTLYIVEKSRFLFSARTLSLHDLLYAINWVIACGSGGCNNDDGGGGGNDDDDE